MQYIMKDPFSISSRLLPAIRIDNAWIEYDGTFSIRFNDGHVYHIEDFVPGAFSTLQGQFASILGFLNTWIDSLEYADDHIDLFDANDEKLKTWALNNADDIPCYENDLNEIDGLLTINTN